MIKYTKISTDDELIALRRHWFNENIHAIAMDFEGEFNLHIYECKLCLIQIFDGLNFYVIDPFRLSEIELKKTLESKDLVKIFYGAESDISLVYKQYGIKINAVLDLKNFVEKKSLDTVINTVMGIKIENKKKFQKHNWTERPIDEDAIQYALIDVQYLFNLKEKLLNMIIAEGKTEALIQRIIKYRFDYDKESIPAFFKSKGYKALEYKEQVISKKIFEIREKYAKEINWPANNLLEKQDIINVSKNINAIECVKPNRKIKKEFWARFKTEILQLKK